MRKVIYRLLLIICIVIFLVSGFMIGKYFYETYKNKSEFSALSSYVNNKIRDQEKLDPNTGVEIDANLLKLDAYKELKEQNSDLVGWITIEGTAVDYPVMQTISDPEFYLYLDFKKEYSRHGTPFLDARCDLSQPSDNMIIYGHHMRDGTMFADLIDYAEPSYYKDHKFIEFNTLDEVALYEIVGVFKTPADGSNAFYYTNYVNFASQEHFDEFYSEVQKRSLYSTDSDFEFGDKLITLSTCEYTIADDGRLAVIAKKIDN